MAVQVVTVPLVTLTRHAWLFVRGSESVRVTRLPTCATLVICGPGSAEHSHQFDTNASLEHFWHWYERRLVAEGWSLDVTPDRRSARPRTRGGPERRRPARRAASR